MRHLKRALLVHSVLFQTFVLQAGEWNHSARIDYIQHLLLDVRLDLAEIEIAKLRKEEPHNLYADLLSGRLLFFRSYLPDHPQAYEEHEAAFDLCLKKVKSGPHKEVETQIASSELYLIKAFLEMRYGSSLGTAWNGYMAWDELEIAIKRSPNHPLVRYGNGLLQATVGSLPENYQFFTRLIGMKGSVNKGLQLMENALQDPDLKSKKVFYDEFAYMFCQVRYQLEDDSHKLLSEYGVKVQGSSFLLYMEALQLLQRGENDRAAELLMNRPTDGGRMVHPYMDLFTGKVLLNRQDPMAAKWLNRYLQNYKGDNHLVAVQRYLYWHYGLMGAMEQAEKHRKLAFAHEKHSAMDQQALEDLGDALPWSLIRARLLFDGGYDEQALVILNDPQNQLRYKRPVDQLEWHYRRGRILFRQHQLTAAQKDFEQAVSVCTEERFNCANSWLHLGFIAEEQKAWEKAKNCFNQVLEQAGFAYFEGLQQKARAGLERIRQHLP